MVSSKQIKVISDFRAERYLWDGSALSRSLLLPFSALYSAIQKNRRKQYEEERVALTTRSKIIGVGGLTVGGSGKTGSVMLIISRLPTKGDTAIITKYRDYARGNLFGDDKILLKMNFPELHLFSVHNKVLMIEELARFNSYDYIIIDDAYQLYSIVKDLEVLTLPPLKGRFRETLIPAGPWRERLREASRADLILYNIPPGADPSDTRNSFLSVVSPYLKRSAEVVGVIRKIKEFRSMAAAKKEDSTAAITTEESGFEILGPDDIEETKVLLLSGTGNPSDFEEMIASLSPSAVYSIRFPDHHWYKNRELKWIESQGAKLNVDYLITTEKDYVRLKVRNIDEEGFDPPSNWYYSRLSSQPADEEALERSLQGIRA